ncbi:hypothetical protein [Cohnella hongkongensis]|uniref:Uncharacterized protein n=1 Tax=Cohnella hongkongensis TaxID=178337 RepID=A0ABV9FD80_9BACL
MILLWLAAGTASIACLMVFGIGSRSAAGKALGMLSAALGIALGVTAGSVTASLGADDRTTAAVGLLGCSLVVIAGSAAARRLLRKSALQRHL